MWHCQSNEKHSTLILCITCLNNPLIFEGFEALIEEWNSCLAWNQYSTHNALTDQSYIDFTQVGQGLLWPDFVYYAYFAFIGIFGHHSVQGKLLVGSSTSIVVFAFVRIQKLQHIIL